MRKIFTFLCLVMVNFTYAQPYRTATFSGNVNNDFKGQEKNGIYAMTWDSTSLFLGVTGGGTFIKDEPTVVYLSMLDPLVGTNLGFDYDNRKGTLPFKANAVVFFKTGYAEVRRDDVSGNRGWSNTNNVVTNNIVTGANDIEIKINWVDLFGTNVLPRNIGIFLFKENGNNTMNDAYFVRPGVEAEDNDDYNNNLDTKPFKLFYRLRTDNRWYTNLNMFQWITNENNDFCLTPTASPVTQITPTSVRLNWTSVAGAVQYQVRVRKRGTTNYTNYLIPGTRNVLNVNGLTCGTNYDWYVRAFCDLVGVARASGFTLKSSFVTAGCSSRAFNPELVDAAENTSEVVVFPVPARKGSRVTVASQAYRNNAGFVLFNISGKKVQQGFVNNGSLNIGNSVEAGTYILELRNANNVVRKKIVVLQ